MCINIFHFAKYQYASMIQALFTRSENMEIAYTQMKLEQLEAVLASATGGNGVAHLNPDQIQALLNASYALALEALQSIR
jgi:hypothetical protein